MSEYLSEHNIDLDNLIVDTGLSTLNPTPTQTEFHDAMVVVAKHIRLAPEAQIDAAVEILKQYLCDNFSQFGYNLKNAAKKIRTFLLPSKEELVLAPVDMDALYQLAKPLLENPYNLKTIQDELRKGYGEDVRLPWTVYLGFTTRLLKMEPGDLPGHMVVLGSASKGKNFLLQRALRLFPEVAYILFGAATDRVLMYIEEPLKHRMFILSEIDSLPSDPKSNAASAVRSFTQDNCLRYATVEKGPDGKSITRHIYKEGPTVLVTTGLAIPNDGGQFGSRVFALYVPTDVARVKNVIRSMGKLQTTRLVEPDPMFRAYQAWLQAMAPIDVMIPYAEALTGMIAKFAVEDRTVRDISRLFSFIKAVTVLRHFHRVKDSDGRFVATLEDYDVIYELLHTVFEENTTQVLANDRIVVNAITEMLKTDSTNPRATVTIGAVANKLKFNRKTVHTVSKRAITKGWMFNLETLKGSPAKLTTKDAEPPPVESIGLPPTQNLRGLIEEMARLDITEPTLALVDKYSRTVPIAKQIVKTAPQRLIEGKEAEDILNSFVGKITPAQFPDGDTQLAVTLSDVKMVPKGEEKIYIARFSNVPNPLRLNQTSLDNLSLSLGADITKWTPAKVILEPCHGTIDGKPLHWILVISASKILPPITLRDLLEESVINPTPPLLDDVDVYDHLDDVVDDDDVDVGFDMVSPIDYHDLIKKLKRAQEEARILLQ